MSAPQVSGAAMLVMAENPSLTGKPEAVKAILMASAGPNVDGGRFNWLHADSGIDRKDGVGVLDTAKAVVLANPANWGSTKNVALGEVGLLGSPGWLLGPYYLAPATGGRMRVAFSWDATTTCTTQYPNIHCNTAELTADLDLYVLDSNGVTLCWSTSYDSSWEACDFPVQAGQTYTVKIYQNNRNRPTTHYGLAWTDVTMAPTPTLQALQHTQNWPPGWSTIPVGWTNGDGEATAVFMAAATSGAPAPVDGSIYLQNQGDPSAQGWQTSTFGQGTQIGTSGWYCVYNGTGSGLGGGGVNVDGLQPGTTYRVMAVTYNGLVSGLTTYLKTTVPNNPMNYSHVATPTTPASSILFYPPIGSSMTVGWQKGDGEATAVFIAQTSAGTPTPADGVRYFQNVNSPSDNGSAFASFGLGSQIGATGWHCVYNGTGTYVYVTGLQANATYRVMAVTYNGLSVGNPSYLTATNIATGNPRNYPPSVVGVPATPGFVLVALALLLCGAGFFRIFRKRGQHAR